MNKRAKIIIIFIVVLAFSLSACLSKKPTSKNELLAVSGEAVFHFLDVGQGDCIFIQSENASILIDAGTFESGSSIYRYLNNLGVDYIDYFIATHPHEDHMGGASTVLASIDVGKIFTNGNVSDGYFYERFTDILIEKDITPEVPDQNCIYKIGDFRIKFLSPEVFMDDENNNSLVFTVEFGETKALFTGDAELSVEKSLINNKRPIDADILKVGHHGSRNASSADFLNAVSPSVSVIQCGEGNSYGHPHAEALKRLNAASTMTYRTDIDGTIILKSDGKSVKKALGEEFKEPDPVSAEVLFIGNMNSMVFHALDCRNLPAEKNQIEFYSRDEAETLGYHACGNCNP